jgi:putative membrane protein insertion efficiency factor
MVLKSCIESVSRLLLFGWLLSFHSIVAVDGACQSCLLPILHPRRIQHQHHQTAAAVSVALQRQSPRSLSSSFLGFLTLKSLQKPILGKPIALAVGFLVTQRVMSSVLRASEEESRAEEDDDADSDSTKKEEAKPMTSAMVATIGVYKNLISPLLPPACRFLPTCSQYGVQAIEEFGPSKGAILTGWRLLRCSPFGGKGYDPPKWPPVAYTYGSY